MKKIKNNFNKNYERKITQSFNLLVYTGVWDSLKKNPSFSE